MPRLPDRPKFRSPDEMPIFTCVSSVADPLRRMGRTGPASRFSSWELGMIVFDWHSDPITRATPINAHYRNTQNVRRFFKSECGDAFKFDRQFMAWLKDGTEKTMGDAADEWLRRLATKS